MGELIRREAAKAPLDFSGERLTAAISGQVEIEHYHRYLLARDYCRDRDVLDCASGEGYGAALLAQLARSVVGVEIDQASVAAAQSEFARPNLKFRQGDARAIPLPDASIDVAVSFETLEHLTGQDLFLSELRRVLRPGGLLMISTPDRDLYSPLGSAPNPFHQLELTRAEFEALLQRHFAHAVVAGQRAMIGSVILGGGQGAPARSFERRGDQHIEGSDHLARAMYLLALASDAPVPPLRDSVYVHRNDLDTDPRIRKEAEIGRQAAEQATRDATQATLSLQQAWDQAQSAARAEVAELERQLVEASIRAAESGEREKNAAQVIAVLQRDEQLLRTQLSRTGHHLAERDERVAYLVQRGEALEQHLANATGRAGTAEQQRSETMQQLAATVAAHAAARQEADGLANRLGLIVNSSIWRGSYPLRRLGSRVPALARWLRIGVKLVWWTATFQLGQRYGLWRDHRAMLRAPLAIAPQAVAPQAVAPQAVAPQAVAPQAVAPQAVAPAALPMPPLPEAVTPSPVPIHVPHSREPVVSVVISTYGQFDVTLACLQSIALHAPSVPIEVILVDDAYAGPEDRDTLAKIHGIVLLRNAVNLGFVLSCNRAARAAKGRYIHLLNNDTEIRPGAIDALAELLDARPDIGMAGSKLVFPDGRLQEAGGILWSDASGWNYGRGESPDLPEFNYLREVDYCSGASIMVRRDLFEALGGFDEAFAPAYYEDTDLAFRIRAKGQKVMYEPRSVVVHHEGASHGADVTAGVKAHQLVNQARMLDRWGDTLARENYANAQHVLRARERGKLRRVILVIEHYALEPDRDAGSRSTMGILESLLHSGWIVKFWPLNRAYSPLYTVAMERRGIEVMDHRWPGDLTAWMQFNGAELDHVLVIRPDTAAETLSTVMAHTDAILSFYGVDLHFARVRRQATLDGNLDLMRHAAFLERLERRVWRNFDLVIYPSEEEAATVREMSPTSLVCGIIPFCFDAAPPRTVPVEGRSVLFVAGFAHPPNVDAAAFLMREIIPRLEAQVGPVQVTLAGSNPSEQVQRWAGRDVTVTGYVTDEALAQLYASHRVSVVPLRFGAGVKGKVVESLSSGLPLVTTPTGVQGIEGLGSVVPVHDDAEGLAAGLALLLTDDAAWLRQSHAQTAFAQSRFSPAAMRRSVLRAFDMGERAAAARRDKVV